MRVGLNELTKTMKEGKDFNEETPDIKPGERDVMENEAQYVKDWKAYDQYKKLRAHPILTQSKFTIYIADDGLKINLGMLQHQFLKKIEYLPAEEQEKIKAKWKNYHLLLNKANAYKIKAFGVVTHGNRDKMITSLIDPRKEETIALFQKMFTLEEVHKVLVKDWKIPVSLEAVQKFRTRHINTITEGIEKYKKEYSSVRLGAKRSRLDELTYLYTVTKDKYKANPNRGDHEVLVKTLEQIRKEVEGDRITFDGNLDINIESTVNIHLQREVFKLVNVNTIIIGRMGARLELGTEEVIARMLKSHYAAFSGAFGAPKKSLEANDYPSVIPYDFDKITGYVAQQRANTEVKIMAYEQREAEVKEDVGRSGLKAILLRKLADKGKELKSKKLDSARAENELMTKRIKLSDKKEQAKTKKKK